MHVLMVNGSSNRTGCTYTALTEVGKGLAESGATYEIMQLGGQPIRDCIGCNQCRKNQRCIFEENGVQEFVEKAYHADGFVFGTPVYFAHPSGRLLSFLDRAFYSCEIGNEYLPFTGKPGAAVASARRAGTTASLDAVNKYFQIAAMPIVSSTYWNMVHGHNAEEVKQDLEGLQIMRNLGRNMAWMMQYLHDAPKLEHAFQTNFIR